MRIALLIGIYSFSLAALSEPVKENIGLYGGRVADIAAIDNAGSTEVLIAVDSSQRGIFKWDPAAAPPSWSSITHPDDTAITGNVPGSAAFIEADVNTAGLLYGVISYNADSRFKALYESSNYGDLTGSSVSWTPSLDGAGAAIDEVSALHGHASGMYASTREGDIYRNTTGPGGVFSSVYSHSSGHEVIDFAVVSSSSGYIVTRSPSGSIALWSTNWGGSNTALTGMLPTAAPIQIRSGSCPISDCSLEIHTIGVDPADTSGNTLYIAGSSTNAMAFKSTDGGSTWNQGWDYQCGQSSSGCQAYDFSRGYPNGDVIRFRGVASAGNESRYIFISTVVLDLDETTPAWESAPALSSTIYPSGSSGPSIIMRSNVNDGAIAIDPNDDSQIYIATDLAIGQITHNSGSGFLAPSGFELGNAIGIEGLVVNDLDYFENSPTDKTLWVVTKSGAGFARGYDPTDPASVADASGWVFPIYVGGDGSPPRTVAIDPNDKSLALIGTSRLYRNDRADGAVDLVDVAINWTAVFDPSNSSYSGPGLPLESDRVERSYTTSVEWQTSSSGSCDRVYLSVANTDTGLEGGIFYSDDDGLSWQVDTLNSGSGLLKMPVNALLSNDNFLWAAVGDREGRTAETGIRARVSLCGSSAWWKPTHSTDTVFAALQNDYITALDGVAVTSGPYDAVIYVTSEANVYKGQKESSSTCTASGFDCWQFSDVSPTASHSGFSAVALEPSDADHVWVAYDNCIVESLDGGLTWSSFGGSCTDDHETVKVLVYDDLISGTEGGAFAYVGKSNPAPQANCAVTGFTYDIDGDSQITPLTDGLLIIRHLFGFTGDALTSNAVEPEATRNDAEIGTYLTDYHTALDIDADSSIKPLTDGLMLIRYFFGFRGDTLIANAVGEGAIRKSAEQIQTCIEANTL